MRIDALVFDCDGTLADTMPLHWQAWQGLMARHGFQMSEERFYRLGGVPSRDILQTLKAEQGLALDPLAVAREKEEAYLALLSHVGPIETVIEVAREYRGRLPLAVASGGTRRVIELVLTHLGIRSWFEAVVTSEDVCRQKPAPDIFLEAARRLAALPQHCVAFEDTELGLQAIRAAGMHAVDVRAVLAGEALPLPLRTPAAAGI